MQIDTGKPFVFRCSKPQDYTSNRRSVLTQRLVDSNYNRKEPSLSYLYDFLIASR